MIAGLLMAIMCGDHVSHDHLLSSTMYAHIVMMHVDVDLYIYIYIYIYISFSKTILSNILLNKSRR